MADNKVTVRIYGQEYSIVGERDSETITEIAEYVDKKIKETAYAFGKNGTLSSIPILASVNIADDLFNSKQEVKRLEAKISQLENDCENYLRMWEDAKKSFAQFKESTSNNSVDVPKLEEKVIELEGKCKEFESSYFELLQENLKLKEQIKKIEQGEDF